MKVFPKELVSELLEIFNSSCVDVDGAVFPYCEHWTVRNLGFEDPNLRQRVTGSLEFDSGGSLDLELNATDFELPRNSGNESRYTNLAFDISIVAQEDIFSRKPTDFLKHRIILGPGGVADDAIKSLSLGISADEVSRSGLRARGV